MGHKARYLTLILFALTTTVAFAQETFTAQNNAGLDLWTANGDWTASVGADRQPDCTNEPITIIIPAGVTTIFRNYPGDVAEFTCEVHLEIYGTLSFRNNEGDPTGLWLNNPNSTVFIDENATIDTTTPGGGDPNSNFIRINNTVLWNGGTDGDYTEDEPGGVTHGEDNPLPIELFDFKVSSSTRGAEIAWSTVSELNNSYFTVSRSLDGVHFDEIARVDGAGTSSDFNEYSIVDPTPLYGVSYYQLTQTDFDGQFEEFPIVSFQNEVIQDNISIFPNPTRGSIRLTGGQNQLYDATMVNMSGRLIATVQQRSLRETESILNQSLPRLEKGVYFVRFKTLGQHSSVRLVVE